MSYWHISLHIHISNSHIHFIFHIWKRKRTLRFPQFCTLRERERERQHFEGFHTFALWERERVLWGFHSFALWERERERDRERERKRETTLWEFSHFCTLRERGYFEVSTVLHFEREREIERERERQHFEGFHTFALWEREGTLRFPQFCTLRERER